MAASTHLPPPSCSSGFQIPLGFPAKNIWKYSAPTPLSCFLLKHPITGIAQKQHQLTRCRAAQGQRGVPEEEEKGPTGTSSARTQLDLLEQLTSTLSPGAESGTSSRGSTIREQLSELVEARDGGDFSLPLGKKLKASLNSLTISQKRNIKRQNYLNEVSRRNDSRFFATIASFVLFPPLIILAVSVLTGYVKLFP